NLPHDPRHRRLQRHAAAAPRTARPRLLQPAGERPRRPRARPRGRPRRRVLRGLPSGADGTGRPGDVHAARRHDRSPGPAGGREAMASQLLRWDAAPERRVRLVRSVADIEAAMADGALAAILHFEGAEAIDLDLAALDVYHAAGLRSLGIVWSRANAFGYGVP